MKRFECPIFVLLKRTFAKSKHSRRPSSRHSSTFPPGSWCNASIICFSISLAYRLGSISDATSAEQAIPGGIPAWAAHGHQDYIPLVDIAFMHNGSRRFLSACQLFRSPFGRRSSQPSLLPSRHLPHLVPPGHLRLKRFGDVAKGDCEQPCSDRLQESRLPDDRGRGSHPPKPQASSTLIQSPERHSTLP